MGFDPDAGAPPPGPGTADAGPTAPPAPPVPAGRWRRRGRRFVWAVVLLSGLGAALAWHLPTFTARVLAARLTRFFHRPVTVAAVRFHLTPFEAEVLGLRVAGAEPGSAPFLEVPRAAVVPSLGTLFSRHIVLGRVRLDSPTVRIHGYPQGGDDIPPMGGGPGGGVEIEVRRLVVEDGAFELDHERVPMNLDLPEFRARLARQRRGVLSGRLEFKPGTLRFGDAPAMPVGTEMELTIEGPRLHVEQAHLRAQGTDLAYSGELHLRGGPGRKTVGQFALRGPLDLDLLERHVMRTGLGIKGDAFYEGGLQVDGSRLRLAGRLRGTRGEYDGVPVPRFDGRVWWDERGVTLRELAVETLDGRGRFDFEAPPRPAALHLRAQLDGLDAEALLQAVFDIGAPGLAAGTHGELEISWPRGRIRRLSGRIGVDLVERHDGRTPLQGRFEWSAENGRQQVERALLHTPSTGVRLSGRIELDERTDLQVDADSSDLAASDELFRRVRLALGTLDAQTAGFSGQGRFVGRWTGSLNAPVFSGRASAARVGYLGVVWGAADWAGTADGYEVRSHSLVLRRPDGELWLDGRVRLGEYGRDDALDVRVRFSHWPAQDFLTAYAWRLDASGLVSGEAQVGGRRSAPVGQVRLTAAEGSYYGVPFEDLELQARFDGDFTAIPLGRARVGQGQVRFRGSASGDGAYDGRVELEAVDVARVLPPLAEDVRWGGQVSGSALFSGTLERPRLQAEVRSPRLFLADEGVGALEARLHASGDGRVQLDGRLHSARVDLRVSGHYGAAPPYPAQLALQASGTSLDPFLRLLAPRLPTALGLVVGGTGRLSGPLLDPRRLQAEAQIEEFELRLPEYPVKNREPVRLELRDGRLAIERVRLAGEGTDLELAGHAALLDNGPLALQARGAADLRALAFVSQRLRGRGAARLTLDVGGTREAPRVEGRLDLEGAGLRARGFPHGIEGLVGTLHFDERGARFSDVRGTLGGGELGLDGQVAYAQGALRSFDVHAAGRGLALRYPEGLRSQLDADLRLFGDERARWISGSVDVRQALYTRRYELASELLAAGQARALQASAALDPATRYDVKVRIPGTLRIDNNLAALDARAELTLQGFYGNPVVLGRAEIERGRVYFQGNTYIIRRGTLDFANPQKTDPNFDIEAEARVRSYRVTLKVNGTLERVYPTLSSDPPLSAVQIVNLLAGADEATVASLTLSQSDKAKLAAAGAATLAAGRLSEQVGLERGAERLLGLNRFSIDPSIVKGGVTNPTARVTVGKRLTPDLNVQYSTDLRGTEERLLSVEYTLSDRLSLLLTRGDPGGYGFDLRLRQSR